MSKIPSHLDKINSAARSAETGSTAADMRDYISTLIDPFTQQGTLRDLIVEKIGDLQHRYVKGDLPPVSETTLVKALNRLGDEMGLPEYGKTNPLEFRSLRVQMSECLPNLNPAALTQQEEYTKANGDLSNHINSEMSPAEATYLVCLLVLQKRSNPSFQKTEAEFKQQRIDFHARKDAVAQMRTSTYGIFGKDSLLSQGSPEREAAINAAIRSFARKNSGKRSIKSFLNSLLKEVGYAK